MVTVTGSTVVRMNAVAAITLARQTRWNRAAAPGGCRLPQDQPMYCATEYPVDRPDSAAAAKVAAKNDTNTTASPALPNAEATGSATWFRWETWMLRGCSTGTAAAMMARLSSPPSGNPIDRK